MTGAITAVRLRLAPWLRALTPGPRLRRRFTVMSGVALVLAAGYMFWLRDSGLVAVKEVHVTGLTGGDAGNARAAIERAARDSTTLHVDRAEIEEVAQAYPAIRALVITPDFPNSMSIRVIEHRPVAVLHLGARRVAVAGDGTVLAGLPAKGSLPTIEISGGFPARQVESGAALDAVRVAGGAPAAITARLEKVAHQRGRGVVVHVKNGPELVFGDAGRIAAKWAAALRVLADRDAAGAEYIDVRIPERPAAGGLPVETVAPVAPAGPAQAEPQSAPVAPQQTPPVTPQATQPTVPGGAVGQQPAAPGTTPATPPAGAGGGVAPNTQP